MKNWNYSSSQNALDVGLYSISTIIFILKNQEVISRSMWGHFLDFLIREAHKFFPTLLLIIKQNETKQKNNKKTLHYLISLANSLVLISNYMICQG